MRTIVKRHPRRTRRKVTMVRSHSRRIRPSPEYISYLQSTLKKEGRVPINNIGILKLKRTKARKARKGINPFTRKPMIFKAKPAGKRIRFYPSRKLKEAVL